MAVEIPPWLKLVYLFSTFGMHKHHMEHASSRTLCVPERVSQNNLVQTTNKKTSTKIRE